MDKIEKAFNHVKREKFVPANMTRDTLLDIPLPIGYGQTISQPSTVEKMIRWLNPQPGETVLDLGSGSGWTTALLSFIVGDDGIVYAVERILELLRFGENNCRKAGVKNTKFYLAEKTSYGLPAYAPYRKILVSASAPTLPPELLDQLAVGGKMIIPVNNDILEITRISAKKYTTITHHGFVFVPLIK